MSAPLPVALRARFQRLIEEGSSGRAAALRLKLLSATGARRGLAIRRTGQARAAPQGRPRGKGKLDPHRSFLTELIDQDGDMTMPELAGARADATSVQVHPDAIGRFLRKLGFTYRKDAGRHRATLHKGKKAARPLVRAPLACRLGPTGSRCLHSLSSFASKRLPGSGGNLCQNQPDPPAWPVTAGRAARHGCALWIMGGHRPLSRV